MLAPEIASNAQQQIVETEHLCKALFEQKDAFAVRIVTEAGADPVAAAGFIDRFISRQPKVSGGAQQVLGRHLESLVDNACLLYTSPSPRDMRRSRMPSSA